MSLLGSTCRSRLCSHLCLDVATLLQRDLAVLHRRAHTLASKLKDAGQQCKEASERQRKSDAERDQAKQAAESHRRVAETCTRRVSELEAEVEVWAAVGC